MNFKSLLKESVKIHGHMCPGQVLGVRLAMLGLNKINIKDPKGDDKKNFLVYVEIDRCATDAIQSVTGCTLGHRSLKFFDYGKMAATFLNLKTKKAVRIFALEDSKEKAVKYFPDINGKYDAQTEAYKIMKDEELFSVMDVEVNLKHEDMPGRPVQRVECLQCGEHVQDKREAIIEGRVLCKPCAEGGYYKRI